MRTDNHQIARDYFVALSSGVIPDEMVVPDLVVRTPTSPATPGAARFQYGIKLFKTVFSDGPHYVIDSITAEDDRVAVEAHMDGTLVDGATYHNDYIFMLRIQDGRIVAVAEHADPRPIIEKIGPVIQAALAKAQS